ncbi:protein translocase subunit SecF [Aggregicoccus sp. 17bor-14]|uniref:protein translocase subunit SecF n=1 Tax=Myxococcaceae TaxID=31 RepID=UPI00129C9061|nr:MULTISPECIES: protein translocase subunit SecF [Myxococcaceae]MBF5045521.1 protein translocase subunit SecF [Simulacricoccus sp. 17bor-14]MRI91258.1 protein translocase subunit SecF [Aggregicoccus sp. 17bor-14]
MQVLKRDTHIDFIGKRKIAVYISSLINLAILVGLAIWGFNFGVDFAGGTVVELKYNHPVSAADVRKRAEAAGLHDVSVQNIGAASENSFLLRLGGVTQLTEEGAAKARTAIQGLGNIKSVYPDVANGIVNFRSTQPVDPKAAREAVASTGVGVKEVRSLGEAQGGGFDYQVVASGMAERITAALSQGLDKPDFETRRVDYVGPQVGKQLRNRGIMALLYSMVAILVYVAFRFDFKFGPGALLAMLHDVIMVCGYYLVSRHEFNLTSIAALLTIVGYSVNDTIVIYDRIREDMAKYRSKSLAEVINIAVNDTLSRTILTSGVTALSLIGLLIFGVGEIWDFAMAMLVGIVVGTYSSVYIASPLTIWLDERAHAKQQRAQISAKAA